MSLSALILTIADILSVNIPLVVPPIFKEMNLTSFKIYFLFLLEYSKLCNLEYPNVALNKLISKNYPFISANFNDSPQSTWGC